MQRYKRIFENNDAWARTMLAEDPEFFHKTEARQEPHFLWIGCSDSRVPAEQLAGAVPGDIFVHRNIGNQVWATDLNLLSVLHYAVHVLDVKHVIVCGHTRCGAIKAAYGQHAFGILDHWLSDLRTVIRHHHEELEAIEDESQRLDRIGELNVLQQVGILARTPTILDAWARGRRPLLHGLVYDVSDGHLRSVVEAIDGTDKAAQLLPVG
ncbi:MAG: carbonic anhydrase [Gemmatimonadota bacterium]|jgi:carbonic anhydrase|nr:carbonic anhydrase [Gemmatimonadota bacterium]